MESFASLLAICEGDPQVTSGFPLQMVNKDEQRCFLCCEFGHAACGS